jgi:two-component system, LytTR family, response regulator AlgR
MRPIRVLIVDDEPLARARLRTLLGDCVDPTAVVVAEAANAAQAVEALQRQPVDLALLDIHMPGADGLTLARTLRAKHKSPAVVFVTAHAEHAVTAFELEALDYLTKPVRLDRLKQSLQKVERSIGLLKPELSETADEFLLIQERGKLVRVPLDEILYLKAELKYLTVRTAHQTLLHDGSLGDLEAKYPAYFFRVHRNALVARRALRALEKHVDPAEGEQWLLRLLHVDDTLAVSRRQLAQVREMLTPR